MTRYTNTGRKRTYLEAGFEEKHASDFPGPEVADVKEEPQVKRKREDKGAKRVKDELDRKQSSEARRLRRIDDKRKDTICFACREKGHAAKDCPKSNLAEVDGDAPPTENKLVGVCYRCGSRKHSLSKCKKPENSKNPLPYASCFVCKQKGHLASTCPQNAGRGIYPDGGCCKMCGQTDHLAKNCPLRKPEVAKESVYFSGEHVGGADEDDFHTIRRRNADIDKEERTEQCLARSAKREARAAPAPSLVNGVAVKRPTAKPKVVAF